VFKSCVKAIDMECMVRRVLLIAVFLFLALPVNSLMAIENPIVFVGQVPQPEDFATIGSTFANHRATVQSVPRGGGLFIRYPDGTIRDLTRAAGYGVDGFQNQNAIAVRDPVVHWSGAKVLFSMVVGSPQRYQHNPYRWQLYEISRLGPGQTPLIRKISGQPESYNNIMPAYTSNDDILFVSDPPIGGTHLYPTLDEYESTPTNTGIFRLDTKSNSFKRLEHSPSGSFHPIVDSFGRVIFTRWDHLQQDQQADSDAYGAFNYRSETSDLRKVAHSTEVFPEPRGSARQIDPTINLHRMNTFFPWMMAQDGRALETINHIGRHELLSYFNRSLNNDSDIDEFIADTSGRANNYSVENFFHLEENPNRPGEYFGIFAPEFGTHGSGQIVSFYAPPGLSADQIVVESITHPDTASVRTNPLGTHSGLYRDVVMTSDSSLLASHTFETRADYNQGSLSSPQSRYELRIRQIIKQGAYYRAQNTLTGGIERSVSFYNPDTLVSYSGDLWELQPVELVARAAPALWNPTLGVIEQNIFSSEQVNLDTFQDSIAQRGLALVVVRDATSRDSADRQQPFNLRVEGSSTYSVGSSGKVYNISDLQFIIGKQIRGYSQLTSGRRVIGQFMENQSELFSAQYGASQGSARVFSDGSVAVLVPASRAISWQLLSPAGESVVRERYWLSLQPGEVRVCSSCHGVNATDQVGRPGRPTNPPDALIALLKWWKESGGELDSPSSLRVFGRRNARRGFVENRLFARRPFRLQVSTPADGATYQVKLKMGRFSCPQPLATLQGDQSYVIDGRLGPIKGRRKRATINLIREGSVYHDSSLVVRNLAYRSGKRISKRNVKRRFCRRSARSIKRLNPGLFTK